VDLEIEDLALNAPATLCAHRPVGGAVRMSPSRPEETLGVL